ncbi:hypothetical protein DAEQUDRAFT_151938 [Daedalea quercina L-15889]|uniref:Uncharacterized protein n=1 Tax=Daedalea quercina L-15889 TaxID=1314783 RepID=A0A165RLJ8_9APHY|nr:hypothetical protein DAEQUDRAFT_151938 [Daedalea quercina L-15889]
MADHGLGMNGMFSARYICEVVSHTHDESEREGQNCEGKEDLFLEARRCRVEEGPFGERSRRCQREDAPREADDFLCSSHVDAELKKVHLASAADGANEKTRQEKQMIFFAALLDADIQAYTQAGTEYYGRVYRDGDTLTANQRIGEEAAECK